MSFKQFLFFNAISCVLFAVDAQADEPETLPKLIGKQAPSNLAEMWSGFDPRSEPMETEVLLEWDEENVALKIVRFRIGVFKGKKAKLAAIYGFPKSTKGKNRKLPGLAQIHGGGQYADYKACLLNAKRGYATLSIAWAGRINAPDYRVTPSEVKLFWDGKVSDSKYKLTTDWGVLDGYHAPGRNQGNAFPSAKPAEWTLDAIESPRNSGWFLCALAARRALTFLEQQPEVDAEKLGVYGHSMGGKLTVMTANDPRVKAAAPSCGGISDRDNQSSLFRKTLGDDVSLKEISCPIIFLSPANDFHGRIGDLPDTTQEIKSKSWRVTSSPHHNHQDTPEYEVATLLWFDQHLKNEFKFPQTPRSSLVLDNANGVPTFDVKPDRSLPIHSVDVYYTQHGKPDETPQDRINTMHRFWHHARAEEDAKGNWAARLPVQTTDKPLWAYANVLYRLKESVTGAGYYYGSYTADSFNLSSVLKTASPKQLQASGVEPTMRPVRLIEDFQDDWQKEWFSYRPQEWPRSTHKLYDAKWEAPKGVLLSLTALSEKPNSLVVVVDNHVAEIALKGGSAWQTIKLAASDFSNIEGEVLENWENIKRLKLTDIERLRSARGAQAESRIVGRKWVGSPPQFKDLRWVDP